MIEVQNLVKHFGATRAVDGISFEIRKGDVVGFLGPNGAGKTTTLRVLTCFHPADAGRAIVNGCDVRKDPLGVRQSIGYLPENVPIYGDMRVREYLTYRAALKGVERGDRAGAVDAAMERCQIADVQRKLVRNVSRGYRQRVGLADALVARPPILILDEPTSGLDPNQRRKVKDLVLELAQEHTILFSSHILAEVEDVSNRILVIHQGTIRADGAPRDLVAQGSGRSVVVTAKAPGDVLAGRLAGVEGLADAMVVGEGADGFASVRARVTAPTSESGGDVRDRVWQSLRAVDVPIRQLDLRMPSLEEYFQELTGGGITALDGSGAAA